MASVLSELKLDNKRFTRAVIVSIFSVLVAVFSILFNFSKSNQAETEAIRYQEIATVQKEAAAIAQMEAEQQRFKEEQQRARADSLQQKLDKCK